MFNQDITIINKIYNKTTKQNEYRVNNTKGFYSSSEGIVINGTRLVTSDRVICRILFKNATNYVPPKEYVGIGWTLKNDDYIVKGLIDTESSIGVITSITDILDEYECFKISNVAIKDYGTDDMQHFEISGE